MPAATQANFHFCRTPFLRGCSETQRPAFKSCGTYLPGSLSPSTRTHRTQSVYRERDWPRTHHRPRRLPHKVLATAGRRPPRRDTKTCPRADPPPQTGIVSVCVGAASQRRGQASHQSPREPGGNPPHATITARPAAWLPLSHVLIRGSIRPTGWARQRNYSI